MKVLAAWSLWPTAPASPGADFCAQDLAPLEERFVPQRPRRVWRHARLALIGASACVSMSPDGIPGSRTGIYLGSGIGNGAEEGLVAEQVIGLTSGLAQGPASPVHFANSVSNSATFYAARVTGARGPNMVVSQEETSFEGALMMADLALRTGEVDRALVGGVDEYLPDREGLVLRIGMPGNTVLGEGSGWLLVGRDEHETSGEILETILLAGESRGGHGPGAAFDVIAANVARLRCAGEPVTIFPGLRVDAIASALLASRIPGAKVTPYLDRCGVFETASALAIAEVYGPGALPGLYLHVTLCRLGVAAVLFRRNPAYVMEQPACG